MEVHHEANVVNEVPLWHHHAEPSLPPVGKKTKQRLTSLADSAPPMASFLSATASHSWESVHVSGPSGPRAHTQTGVEVAEGRPGGRGGQNCMCALPGPLSQCVSAEQMSYCSSSSSPFMTTTPHAHPLPPTSLRWATGGCRGGSSGGHLLILKIWTSISLLSKSVKVHLLPPPPLPTPPLRQTVTPPLSFCSTSAQVDGPPRASSRNACI